MTPAIAGRAAADPAPLLSVKDLKVTFGRGAAQIIAVQGFSLELQPSEVIGVIGESGSGKTTVMRALMGLLPAMANVGSGQISFCGRPVFGAGGNHLQSIRGSGIGMVFQSASSSINPLFTIGYQLRETWRTHRAGGAPDGALIELLRNLGLKEPERVLRSYPHQLSGGMLQRAAIALAVAVSPKVVIADECTSALDVTTQIEVIDVLRTLVRQGHGLIYVTHDLLLAGELCNRLIVMYAGQIVETGDTQSILQAPRHPYTRALIAAVPTWEPKRPLRGIEGLSPQVTTAWRGCVFAPRCPSAATECTASSVPWAGNDGRGWRCILAP